MADQIKVPKRCLWIYISMLVVVVVATFFF